MATVKDVAREARVSLGTVSNVLNNLSTVSAANRERVEQAIKKLGYRPNHAARTLRTNETSSLGLIIPDITNPFYPEVSRGMEDVAMKNGYTVLFCNSDRNIMKERKYIDFLIEKRIDGIVIVKPQISAEEIKLISVYARLVLVDSPHSVDLPCDYCDVDDFGGSLSAIHMLCDLGHKRIAVIEGIASKSGSSRSEAYFQGLRDYGLDIDFTLIKRGAYDWRSGYACMEELLKGRGIPTAVFAANDLMAIGAVKCIREKGLSVPDDISVIGYDDIDMAILCQPPLTTVRQPKYGIGSLSAELLIRRIHETSAGNVTPYQKVSLPAELIIRDSVRSPAIQNS